MNVTFNGYLTLTCSSCSKPLTLESQALKFEEDLSVEAEDDDYIRYITQIDTCCAICSTKLNIKVDVWEHPEAVSNYSYYDVQGAHDIQCEFNIEHYFDDEAPGRKVEREVGGESEGETDTEHDEKKFNETLDPNTYVDNYDDDN